MTRDEFEKAVDKISLDYPFRHIVNYLKAHDTEQRAEIAAKQARIQALEARLGLDVCYTCVSIEPYLEDKRTLTDQEKLTFPDKVACLEADVQLRDSKIEQQGEEIARLRAALVEIVEKCEDEDWEYMFGDILIKAKQALKE